MILPEPRTLLRGRSLNQDSGRAGLASRHEHGCLLGGEDAPVTVRPARPRLPDSLRPVLVGVTLRPFFASIAYILLLASTAGVCAEVTARDDDFIRQRTPMRRPTWDGGLFVETPAGRRGKPGGHYKKWKLNEFGFRSGPMAVNPTPGITRVVVLGASETFGLYEAPGREFPARLQALLGSDRYEVINAGMAGLTLKSALHYWTSWVARFEPAIVIVYPSPLFYLAEGMVPQAAMNGSPPDPAGAEAVDAPVGTFVSQVAYSSRLLGRLRDRLDVPAVIQRRRDARAVETATRGKPPAWFFREVPRDRVVLFEEHLDSLLTALMEAGTQPLVLTHATRVASPLRPTDLDWLVQARVRLHGRCRSPFTSSTQL